MAKHNDKGRWGEREAENLLVSKGYAIVERNWRMGPLEMDLIAMKDDRIVFVEVKTRADDDADPIEAVTEKKIRNLVRAAHAYMNAMKEPFDPQFDLIGITGNERNFRIEHIPDAFLPPVKFY
ncbi:MAG: YraN family protein [Muribaculaceae bacterium]|nr:YraN family protein [Muribaculaceae bacterium]